MIGLLQGYYILTGARTPGAYTAPIRYRPERLRVNKESQFSEKKGRRASHRSLQVGHSDSVPVPIEPLLVVKFHCYIVPAGAIPCRAETKLAGV
jgi:hypothetical protein